MHGGFVFGVFIGFALRVAQVSVLGVQHPRISDRVLNAVLMEHFVESNRRHSVILCDLSYGDIVFAVKYFVIILCLDREVSVFQ